MAWRLVLALGALAYATGAAAKDASPLALVESVENAPAARVAAYDYVYPGDEIDLRPGGAAQVAYFQACFVDAFQGGLVKITKDGARVSKGGKSTRQARPCETAALIAGGDGREAGVAVKRVTPFQGGGWRELTVRTARPVFTWPRTAEAGEAQVAVYALEASPKTLVWNGKAAGANLAYPEDAPPLTRGLPYEVTVQGAKAKPLTAVFSVDPDLEEAGGLLNSVVPLGF